MRARIEMISLAFFISSALDRPPVRARIEIEWADSERGVIEDRPPVRARIEISKMNWNTLGEPTALP